MWDRAPSRMRIGGLGAEILDDDLLDVTVALVQLANRQERVDPLFERFADADEDAGGERDAKLACCLDDP